MNRECMCNHEFFQLFTFYYTSMNSFPGSLSLNICLVTAYQMNTGLTLRVLSHSTCRSQENVDMLFERFTSFALLLFCFSSKSWLVSSALKGKFTPVSCKPKVRKEKTGQISLLSQLFHGIIFHLFAKEIGFR